MEAGKEFARSGQERQTSQAAEGAFAKARAAGVGVFSLSVGSVATSAHPGHFLILATSYFGLLLVPQAPCIPNLIGHAGLCVLYVRTALSGTQSGVTENLLLSCY